MMPRDFQHSVTNALHKINCLLETEREPILAGKAPHTYQDKYLLAEFLASCSILALLAPLEALGCNRTVLHNIMDLNLSHAVQLRFQVEESCVFLREESRSYVSNSVISETFGEVPSKAKTTEKVITEITEYFWLFSVQYTLSAFVGSFPDKNVLITTNVSNCEIKTTSTTSPKPQQRILPDHIVNISPLLFLLDPHTLEPSFHIDRSLKSCRTPRRNHETENLTNFYLSLSQWCSNIEQYFVDHLFPIQKQNHGLDLKAINDSKVFVPVLPVFSVSTSEKSSIIPLSDIKLYLEEQRRTIEEVQANLRKSYPVDQGLVTFRASSIVLSMKHIQTISEFYFGSVNYIERIIEEQLISAIGKEIRPVDLLHFMESHSKRYLNENFCPESFCYPVRRLAHYPEGILSCEFKSGHELLTSTRKIGSELPMKFSINNSCRITTRGNHFLHGWLNCTFSNEKNPNLQLVARAKPFSSFILVIGNITTGDSMIPKHAIIIRNKEEILIPLLLQQIPSPKSFRDAVESLSSEQQLFARAYRNMQLESSLLGICIIQLKPQLESLLGLPNDSLTKEIQLTEDLTDLFIDQQISSDLLRCTLESAEDFMLEQVKNHVAAIQNIFNDQKEREIEEARLQRAAEEQQARERDDKRRHELLMKEAESVFRNSVPDSHRQMKSSALMCTESSPNSFAAPGILNSISSIFSHSVTSNTLPTETQNKRYSDQDRQLDEISQAVNRIKDISCSISSELAEQNSILTSLKAEVAKCAPKMNTAKKRTRKKEPTVNQTATLNVDMKNQNQNSSLNLSMEPSFSTIDSNTDYTKIPGMMDAKFNNLDSEAALHSTILQIENAWKKRSQDGLLGPLRITTLDETKLNEERDRAFDLLDALSRSGELEICNCDFHVIVAATHAFDRSLVETVAWDNINPIEKLERSLLIVASTIHGISPKALVSPSHLLRTQRTFPMLFCDE